MEHSCPRRRPRPVVQRAGLPFLAGRSHAAMTRLAAALKPTPTKAMVDDFGDHLNAATTTPGGAFRCGSDRSPVVTVVGGAGEVLAKASSIAGTKAAMS